MQIRIACGLDSWLWAGFFKNDRAAVRAVRTILYSMVKNPSWAANWFAASQEIPAFHETRRFITALTSVRHLSLSWASPIQSIYPHPTSWISILILSTHLYLGLPSGLPTSGFPTKTLYTPFSSPICATCPTYLILLDFIARTILGEEYKSFSSSLCNHLAVRTIQYNNLLFYL